MGQHLNVDFKIRLPHELKDKIRASADEHNRTMTADIVARLEQSFSRATNTFSQFSQEELEELSGLAGKTYIKAMVKLTKHLPKEQAEREMLNIIYEIADM